MDFKNSRFQRAKKHLCDWLYAQSVWSIVGICVVIAAIMTPAYSFRIFNPVNSDFGNHNQFARDLLAGLPMPPHIAAHPFYQWILAGLVWLSRSRVDVDHASLICMVLSQVTIALLIYFWLGKRYERFSEIWRCLIAIGATIATPLFLLQPVDGQYYFGYIGLANYHNPTVTYLRPFAILMMIRSLSVFSEKKFTGCRGC
jgi:hypothetical protein